jgi:HPt (histidine-containing phosphotransfer) domain-containing protein
MLFLESSLLVLQNLQEVAARNDLSALRRDSHILFSSSAAVGALLLSSQCKDLEIAAVKDRLPTPTPEFGQSRGSMRKRKASLGLVVLVADSGQRSRLTGL